MSDEQSAPATKQDIAMLMAEIGKLYDANRQWKEELKHHFDVVAENIHHDMMHGALSDKVEQHADRIRRVEQHVGLVS